VVRLSTYISTYNGLFYQSTLEATIRQSLLFSDEVVVVGSDHSTDGSNVMLDDMAAEDSRIKVYLFSEKRCQETLAEKKTLALRKCTGDYCILQDDDEMIHERYAETIRRLPVVFPDTTAFRFDVIHFYRSFTRHQVGEGWYPRKIYMIKNLKQITHGKVNRDRDNFLLGGAPLDLVPHPQIVNAPVTVFHYGWCRHDAVMQMKKYFQEVQWWGKDYWKTHDFPVKFDNPDGLPEFMGTHPRYMIPLITSKTGLSRSWLHPTGIDMKKWWDSYLCISRKAETGGSGNDHMDLNKLQPYIDEFYTLVPADRYRKVLDIGAGDGGETKLLLQKGYEVVGMTFGNDNIEMAKTQYSINLVDADMHVLDYPPDTFDAIFLLQTFEHFLSPFVACLEMWRVLKTGGRIYICVPDPDNDKEWTIWHTNLLYPKQIINLFNLCGFSCIHQDLQKQVEDIDKRYPRFVFEKLSKDAIDKWGYLRFIHDARDNVHMGNRRL
jgi:SAM-dependent methyltransferase